MLIAKLLPFASCGSCKSATCPLKSNAGATGNYCISTAASHIEKGEARAAPLADQHPQQLYLRSFAARVRLLLYMYNTSKPSVAAPRVFSEVLATHAVRCMLSATSLWPVVPKHQ